MKNVQDIYPVTPMQEFMLLHGLGQSRQDTLFNQFVFSVDHSLSVEAFARAWEQVVQAHAALRTAFIWKGVEVPQQVVRQTISLPCDVVDLSSWEPEHQQLRFRSLLDQDRKTGFDFRRAPLMRFSLVKFGKDTWRVVWSSHHLIVDRWCIDQLLGEFQEYYRAHINNQPKATRRAPSFRDYAAWIKSQNLADAQRHWSDYLGGFEQPVSVLKLLAPDATTTGVSETVARLDLGHELSSQLRAVSTRLNVTVSCVVQAAVGMAINALSSCSDVVFGMTVAGRPVELPHVEDTIGSFISTVPVRVTFNDATPVGEWLRELNAAQFANSGFDYLSPAQFRACAPIPSDRALFDVLMVWLAQSNVQETTIQERSHERLPLVAESEQYATAYPITLSVIERPDRLIMRADIAEAQDAQLSRLLETIRLQLCRISGGAPERSLGQFGDLRLSTGSHEQEGDQAHSGVASFAFDSQAIGAVEHSGREDVHLDAMQDVVRGEWQSVLVLDNVNPQDDFFELGGDSIKASILHTRLEAATRKTVPLLALFEHSTIEGMAQTLVGEAWPLRDGIVVPLRTSGSEAPLFCVASPEVNTLGYAMLARHLPERRNMVLLQAPPRGDALEQLHPDELEEYAANYIEALREVQPQGPYSFLSMCSGAQIAFYMIRQLEQAGEQVKFAGVINTWSLYSISRRFYLNRFVNVYEYYIQRLREEMGVRFNRHRSSQADLTASSDEASEVKGSPTLRVVPAESAVGLDNPWIKQVGFAHLLPSQLSIRAPVTVFRLDAQPYWRTGGAALGWSRLASTTHVVTLEGDDHDAILREPRIQQVALLLDAALARSSKGVDQS